MLLEVCIAHNRSYEARSIFDSCCICLWIWTVEGEMEVEVREVLLKLEEVIEEWNFLKSTRTIEVVHWTLTILWSNTMSLEHVHDLCTERSHTGTTTYPDHLTTCAILWTELTIRA